MLEIVSELICRFLLATNANTSIVHVVLVNLSIPMALRTKVLEFQKSNGYLSKRIL